jgi:hypothetical protein
VLGTSDIVEVSGRVDTEVPCHLHHVSECGKEEAVLC